MPLARVTDPITRQTDTLAERRKRQMAAHQAMGERSRAGDLELLQARVEGQKGIQAEKLTAEAPLREAQVEQALASAFQQRRETELKEEQYRDIGAPAARTAAATGLLGLEETAQTLPGVSGIESEDISRELGKLGFTTTPRTEPPLPSTQQTVQDELAPMGLGEGFARGLTNIAGFPVDAINYVLGMAGLGTEAPVAGARSIKYMLEDLDILPQRSLQPGGSRAKKRSLATPGM